MARIAFPSTIQGAPEASRAALAEMQQQVGMVPNAFRMLANGPAALQGYLGLRGALSHGTLDETMQRRIALAVSEINGSEYCVAGNTYLARMGKPDDAEITANRNGASNDPYADAAVRFAAKIARARGHVSDDDVRAAKAAGYTGTGG